jgi:hypothetical protein
VWPDCKREQCLGLGLDALLGTLLPGAGDVLGGVTAALVMFVAWRHGASRGLLVKMLGNATADIAFGSIPVVGDIFDLGFHANRRNLSLLEEFLRLWRSAPLLGSPGSTERWTRTRRAIGTAVPRAFANKGRTWMSTDAEGALAR